MMRRHAFLAAAAALGLGLRPGKVSATGGLDPDAGPPAQALVPVEGSNPAVRVLLASNVTPQAFNASGAATFSYAGKTYRGGAALVDGPERRPSLVATLPIDSYLYGVVPLEIGRRAPDAALQAQAILARTYALSHRVIGRTYDLVAHEGDQVWGGIDVESPETNAAVDATLGQIVTYGGGLASIFYASCCGGHTADAGRLWGAVNLPYLRGVADPYCLSSSPDAHWRATLTVGRLVAALGPKAASLGTLRSVGLGEPAEDERRMLVLAGTGGRAEWSSAEVRRAVGGRVLRGPLWRSLTVQGDAAQAGTTIAIEGSGLGHGVGLCQWGARVMAQRGSTAREIIAYFFPGTVLANV